MLLSVSSCPCCYQRFIYCYRNYLMSVCLVLWCLGERSLHNYPSFELLYISRSHFTSSRNFASGSGCLCSAMELFGHFFLDLMKRPTGILTISRLPQISLRCCEYSHAFLSIIIFPRYYGLSHADLNFPTVM